jgi:hypothetical protein
LQRRVQISERLEVQAGEGPGPYSNEAAARYARRALAHRHAARSRARQLR